MNKKQKLFFSIKNFNVITQTLNEYLIIKNRNQLSKKDHIEIYNLMRENYNEKKSINILNKIVIQKYLTNHSNRKSINNFQFNDFQKINKNMNIEKKNLKLKSGNEIINNLYEKKEFENQNDNKIQKLKRKKELITHEEEIKPFYSKEDLKNYSLIDYIQSKPDDKYKQITNKLLIIDSRERENFLSTNSNSYRIKLNKPLKNIEEIELKSVEIPITKYNINDTNNSLIFNIGISSFNIELPNGIYDVIDMETVLGSKISDELTDNGITNNFEVNYDTIQNKFVMKNEILFDSIYDENLIVWYPGNSNYIFGTTMQNLGISGNITATFQNGASTSTTKIFDEVGFQFDGTDDFISISNNPSFGTNDEFTISMYLIINTTIFGDNFVFFTGNNTVTTQGLVYLRGPGDDFDGDGNGERTFIAFRNNSGTYYRFIGYSNVNDTILTPDGTILESDVDAFTGITWLNGKYQHHAFVFNSNNDVDYYLNGIFISTVNVNDNSLDLNAIGSGYSGNILSLDGFIDDFRVYNTALTAEGISRIYQENNIENVETNAKLDNENDYQFNLVFPSTTGLSKNLGFISTSVTSNVYTNYSSGEITRLNLTDSHTLISDIPATLQGEPFMIMDIKNLKAELVSNNELFEEKFAKIPLTNELFGVEYFNQNKIKAKKIFNPPLASLDYLDIEFLDSNGELYDFNGHQNSLSLNFKTNSYQLPLYISSNKLTNN